MIVHAHTSRLISNRFFVRLFLPVQKWLIRHYATEYWACSCDAGDFIFGKDAMVRIIPNAIDLDAFVLVSDKIRNEQRAQWGCNDETVVLVHAGSFSSVKNQEFLIEIAMYLKMRAIDYRLILVGKNDNEYGQKIKDIVQDTGLSDRVLFLGVRDDLHLIFSGADCFLFPSLFEGLGIVCIEAQAAGLYCILSPGIPDEVDMGLNLTEFSEDMVPEEWVEKILAMANSSKPLKQMIINNMREKGYDIRHNILELEKLYISCCQHLNRGRICH